VAQTLDRGVDFAPVLRPNPRRAFIDRYDGRELAVGDPEGWFGRAELNAIARGECTAFLAADLDSRKPLRGVTDKPAVSRPYGEPVIFGSTSSTRA